ncbi:MAG: ATP-binding protein [Gammaproteobacteria bacterium]|nr:ATP-binding protein [Gammaproteobacteria bacterium]
MTSSSAIFDKVFHSINVGLLIVDHNCSIRYANQWFKKHYPYSLDDALGKHLLELFPEANDSRLYSAIQESLKSSTPIFLSTVFHGSPLMLYRHKSAPQDPIQQDISILPLHQEGEPMCLVQIIDVSSRTNREVALQNEIDKRLTTEKSLQQSETRLKSILDNAPLLISLKDTDGNLILTNKQYDAAMKLRPNTATEEPDGSGLTRTEKCAINFLQPVEIEETVELNNSITRTYHSIKFPILEEDSVSAVGSIALDITERKESELQHQMLIRQLQQAQKMESIGQLTGGIAHDFNNILTSVLGYTQLSQDCLRRGGINKIEDYLTEVYSAATKAQKLVKQMLAFSRGQEIRSEKTDAGAVLDDAISLLKPTLPASIILNTTVTEGPHTVQAHSVALGQAILNLAINARDALHNKGNISIELKHTVIENQYCASCHEHIGRRNYVSIQISDNGPGIDAAQKDRIFEPFYTTKPVGKGSGMGLSMVHGIIHNFGGHILLHTPPEGGTSFQLLLPMIEASQEIDVENAVVV